MQKAEAQQQNVRNQPASGRWGGAAAVSPQGERTAQLEATIESSPQAERLGGLASMIAASPAMTAQHNRIGQIHNSPAMVAQGKACAGFNNISCTAQRQDAEGLPQVEERPLGSDRESAQKADVPGGLQGTASVERTEGSEQAGNVEAKEKHAALESNASGGIAGEVSPDISGLDGRNDANAGNEVPVAGAAGESQGGTVAAPDTNAGSIVVEQPEVAAGQDNAAGGGNKGSADAAIDFLNSPASVIARGVGQLGGRLASGFHEDVDKLAATTPSVTAGISKAGIEPPRKIPVPKKAAAPAPGKWTPPAVAIRSDAPKFSPAGNANPQAAETEAASRGAQVAAGGNRLNAEIVGASGEELVQGRRLNATEHVRLTATKTSVQANAVPEMEEYMNIDMPEGFRQQVDAASAGMFRQSLAGPREQIENAKARRDQDQAGAILDANRQADALGKKANEEQAQTIKLSRDRIGAEKEKSLAESKSVLAEYDGKVSKEKQGKINEINAQIASHEKQANTALVEADTKVAAEQQKADRQKAEEERKGAEAKKKRKWWQKVGDFFSNIAKSVAKAVSTIVNALASVVKSIVTAAKTLANSIINTCTALVKKLLDTFASVVKGFLDVALAAFPAIRKRLNAAIDKFVSAAAAAIDKIADTLKAAVNKLCDTLTQIVEFAQNFMVSAIQGAVLMFNAIITGNFADLPRIAFMTACNSLGLPGEELWSIVQKAAGQAMEIIKKPAKFLGNLIKAGMQGFGQFVGNIKQHIMSGLMGWLMGQVGQSGITLPEKFDGPSIFLLVRQVLGVTYEYVRERAVSIIGEKNAARVEMVLNYLKRLFTEPAALFAELKEKATEMKDSFIDQIQDWAITTVIQKAVIKVTSMLIPGSGFVQAIYGMWQTLQFFLENIKKIAAVVNSLLDSMAQISKGAIGAAANYVEKTMVDTLPLVFSWLAKLIGIDGIGQKVKSIIDKLRTPVNSAVDFVIKGAMKLGSAAMDKVKGGVSAVKDKVAGWWRGRKEFTTRDGEAHAVYVEEGGRIVVNPVPKQDVASFLDKVATKLPEDAKQKKIVQDDIAGARAALVALKDDMAEMEDDRKRLVVDDGVKSAAGEGQKKAQGELEQLAVTLKCIMEATGVALPGEGGPSPDEIGKMSSEQRKAGAMNRFISLMKARKSMDKQELDGILVNLKSQFKLSDAKLEGEPQNAKIGFYASPATYLPVMLVMPPIDGQKAGAVAAGRPSVTAGDYIRAINYDGPFPTPGHEVATEFDARFMGQNTVYSSASVASPKKKSKVQSVVGGINPASLNLHTQTNANTYHRAGAVEAKSSVERGTGRSGAGETLFGHFGADEEKILTGKHNTNYNGGHLIGDQIMDSHQAFNLYEDWNLAPQQRSFNSPVYTSTIENPVTAAIKAGATVEYTVTVQYPATTYPIQPSVLVKNLYSADAGYRKEVEGAIALNPGLDAPFDLTRRTPGFWQATANVVAGPNIASGNIGIRQNVAFENNPANVQAGAVYSPMNQEQVRYSLEIDQGGGWQAQAGPAPTRYQYAGAQSIRVTARQQTF